LSAAAKTQEQTPTASAASAPKRTSPVLKPSSPMLKPVSPVHQAAPIPSAVSHQPPLIVADMGRDGPISPVSPARERSECSPVAPAPPADMHPDDVAVMAAEQKAAEALIRERAERIEREKEASGAKAKSDAEAAAAQQAAIMAAIAQATMAAAADQAPLQSPAPEPLTEQPFEASPMAEVDQAAQDCVEAAKLKQAATLAEAEQVVATTSVLGEDLDDDVVDDDLAKQLEGMKAGPSPTLGAAEAGPDLGALDDFDCGDLDDGFLSD